jgi:DNA-binding LytR/AlgR family response regulator
VDITLAGFTKECSDLIGATFPEGSAYTPSSEGYVSWTPRTRESQFLDIVETMHQRDEATPSSGPQAVSAQGTLGDDLNGAMPANAQRDRLLVKSSGRILLIRADEVDWVEAQGDYVCLHVQGKKHLARQKISRLDRELPPHLFLRIHRSTIVNLDRVKELQPLFYGEYAVILQDGTRLTMSRSFRERAFQRLIPVG